MRILFWNVRGLGKSYRRNLVKEHILQEELDIVALQETIKQDFEDWELREMARNKDFSWHWTPARGHSGGMILSICNDDIEIELVEMTSYFLAAQIRIRSSNFRFWVINVYELAQHENSDKWLHKEGF